MAKDKKEQIQEPVKEVIKTKEQDEFIEVIGIVEAEQLQKSGLELISVKITSEGKVFKFKEMK